MRSGDGALDKDRRTWHDGRCSLAKGSEIFVAGAAAALSDSQQEDSAHCRPLLASVEARDQRRGAKDHRFRSVLWKYLGGKEVGGGRKYPSSSSTDGPFPALHGRPTGVVPDDQLATEISNATDMQQCAERLGQLALDQGSRDNVSCVVVEVVEG